MDEAAGLQFPSYDPSRNATQSGGIYQVIYGALLFCIGTFCVLLLG